MRRTVTMRQWAEENVQEDEDGSPMGPEGPDDSGRRHYVKVWSEDPIVSAGPQVLIYI